MHVAAANDSRDVIERLVESGASPNARDGRNATAAHWAADYDEVAALKKLQSLGRRSSRKMVRDGSLSTWPTGRIQRSAAAWLRQQPEVREVLNVLGAARSSRRRPPPTPPPARSPEAALKSVFDSRSDIDATITVQAARRALEASAPRLLGVDGEAFSRALERLDGADSAQKLSWQQFRRVVASLAVLARADLALSPLSPATIESTFADDDDTVEPPPPPPPDSPPPRDVDEPPRDVDAPPLPPDATPPAPRRSVEEVATRLDAIAAALSPSSASSARPVSVALICAVSFIHTVAVGNAVAFIGALAVFRALAGFCAVAAPRPPSFHAEETPARRLRPRADDGPVRGQRGSVEPAGVGGAPPAEAASPSSPWDEAPAVRGLRARRARRAWAETLEELRADPDSPIGQLVFGDAAEDDAADADAASAARERRELENRDAATVRALELAVARAEAATAGRLKPRRPWPRSRLGL